MSKKNPEPGEDGFVEFKRNQWKSRQVPDPICITVIEFYGDGDPAFGGNADDRSLGAEGQILTRVQQLRNRPMEFASLEQAHEACKTISNRRENSILGIACTWH